MTSIQIKQNPIIFVQHFSFLSDKNFQTVGQLLSSNYSKVYAKTEIHRKYVRFSSIGDLVTTNTVCQCLGIFVGL